MEKGFERRVGFRKGLVVSQLGISPIPSIKSVLGAHLRITHPALKQCNWSVKNHKGQQAFEA
jgi:hypothetical protein